MGTNGAARLAAFGNVSQEWHNRRTMRKFVGVLEDDVEGRIPAFRAAGATLGAPLELVLHESAPAFVAWLESAWEEVALLSLDHDLGIPCERGGRRFEPGEGMDVVRFLVRREPLFPVIVHSANPVAAEGMALRLADAGWPVYRLPPFGGDWITIAWTSRVELLLQA